MHSGQRRVKAQFFYVENGRQARSIYDAMNARFAGVFFHVDEEQGKVGFTLVYDNLSNKRIREAMENMGAVLIP